MNRVRIYRVVDGWWGGKAIGYKWVTHFPCGLLWHWDTWEAAMWCSWWFPKNGYVIEHHNTLRFAVRDQAVIDRMIP